MARQDNNFRIVYQGRKVKDPNIKAQLRDKFDLVFSSELSKALEQELSRLSITSGSRHSWDTFKNIYDGSGGLLYSYPVTRSYTRTGKLMKDILNWQETKEVVISKRTIKITGHIDNEYAFWYNYGHSTRLKPAGRGIRWVTGAFFWGSALNRAIVNTKKIISPMIEKLIAKKIRATFTKFFGEDIR